MIKKIIKCLKENNQVTDWLIEENICNTSEAFYVLQHLETTRVSATIEYKVTIYHKFSENNHDYLGSSSFLISHKLSNQVIDKLINDAVYAAGFVKNEYYEIVKGEKRRSWKEKAITASPFTTLDQIANTIFKEANEQVKFNSLELFFICKTIHIINSQNVDLKKALYDIKVEAIPSYNGKDLKVEVYKDFNYRNLDLSKVANDAHMAVADATSRYFAEKIPEIKKADVLLKEENAQDFFTAIIDNFSFTDVYQHSTDKKIGDFIQTKPKGDKLTIGFKTNSPANAFDSDGVILKPIKIVDKGQLVNYYGSNRYAYYLNMQPTGNFSMITVKKGLKTQEKLKKEPHLEIIALSNIQIDIYSGYIGGEVRLANYFDGERVIPVSGFSFSGDLNKCLSNLYLSKETIILNRYEGPRYIKLIDIDIL